MDDFSELTKKTFTTSRSLQYTYYISKANPEKPTLLLLHGFPDSADLYAGITKYLLTLPFQLLIPDVLGYAGTSKPTDPSLYRAKSQTQDLVEILDTENIKDVIVGGHDWGSFLAQQVVLYQRERVRGVILLSVAWMLPSTDELFELDDVNEQLEKMTGYPRLARTGNYSQRVMAQS